ncbi:HXXEE domain-containing protein [Rhodanobacter sp. DHB23]|uniref:HXXEE domain-containing protein n=1 Tax=Rhodanobacter sp. DHB23 TaxID=2775923 RepID=UPI00177EBD3D|nr:HXXEE domain-containing protein [Rhodanobacter sp. DHB23]MBD8871958.1 HXXEE domain-containing protein [Rhodanobacter sp. DHB23]
MSLPLLGWLFALGVVAHNAEEAWLLPSWPGRPRFRWAAVDAGPFRFAAAVLSLAALLAAWLAGVGGAHSVGAYLIAGYAAAMVLNVFLPHLAATVALRAYAPGTATALLFNLPLGGWLVYRSLAEHRVEPSVFAVSGPLTVLGIAVFGASLLWLGQRWVAAPGGRSSRSGMR